MTRRNHACGSAAGKHLLGRLGATINIMAFEQLHWHKRYPLHAVHILGLDTYKRQVAGIGFASFGLKGEQSERRAVEILASTNREYVAGRNQPCIRLRYRSQSSAALQPLAADVTA